MPEAIRNVLLVIDRIMNPEQAGTVRALVGRLGTRGVAAKVLCNSAGELGVEDDVSVIECPGLGDRWRRAWTLQGLRLDDGSGEPSLIHVFQARMAPVGLDLSEGRRIPYLQGVEEFLPDGSRLRLSRRWCRGIVATSRELADDLRLHFEIPENWIRVVPRGLAGSEPAVSKKTETSVSVVGTAGRLHSGAGFATFLNAARRVLDAGIDAEFVIVGQGEDEDDLHRRAERLKIVERVTFAGDAAAGFSFWDVLDVYCQPATIPTVGRNLARALAHGLPAVASDIEGLRSIVRHRVTGLRIPPGDTDALAKAILELLENRPYARSLGLAGREAILFEHDIDREAETLAGLYRSLAATAPRDLSAPPS